MNARSAEYTLGRALVVDDSAPARDALERMLEQMGFAVEAVASAEDAYRLAVRVPPTLIVSDVQMQGLSGVHLARLVRSDPEISEVPLVLLTSDTDPRGRFWARHAGADACLPKDEAVLGLEPTIHAVLAAHGHASAPPKPRRNVPDPVFRVGEILDDLLFEAVVTELAQGLMSHTDDRTAFLEATADLLLEIVDGAFVVFEVGNAGREGTVVIARGAPCANEGELIEALGVRSEHVVVRHDPHRRWGSFAAIRTPTTPHVVLRAGHRDVGRITICGLGRGGTADLETPTLVARAFAPIVASFCTLLEARHNAATDPLMGIANRRHGHIVLERELASAERYAHPMSIILADIDHFKQVNDTYGHAVGDEVLKHVARTIGRVLRVSDTAVRWGGEEILLVLPHAPLESAAQIADRLRVAISASTANASDVPRVTCSFGVASVAQGAPDWVETVARADKALYLAKSSGRDRVEVDRSTHRMVPH